MKYLIGSYLTITFITSGEILLKNFLTLRKATLPSEKMIDKRNRRRFKIII